MTAFLHSVMIQEKRGMLKKWNLALIIGSWLLSIFGTFIARSGVISSVHSFTQSNVGYFFLFFLLVAGAASFTLYAIRLPLLTAEARLESMVSREASFLFNNLLFVGIAFSVLWGTLFPILSELVQGTKVTVGPPFFNQVNIPLGLALLGLTGIGPLIAWRRASLPNLRRQFAVPVTVGVFTVLVLLVGGMRDLYAVMAIGLGGFVTATVVQEFGRGAGARHRQYGEAYPLALGRLLARNRRRYGGYIVHVGIVILFIAFAGMAFKTETEATLRPGEAATLRSPYGWTYRFTHLGVSQYDALNRQVTAAALEIERNGKRLGVLTTEKRQHVDGLGRPTFQPSTEVGIRSDLREDLYVVLAGRGSPPQAQDSLPGTGPSGKLWDPSRAGRPFEPVRAADNDAAIQAIEKQIHCTCGCNLDVYTCRTTDFTCGTSPAMHRRVVALAEQGKTAQEILAAFVKQNGVSILMAPPKRGFNLVGYFVPSLVILIAGAILTLVLRRWSRAARPPTPSRVSSLSSAVAASPEELERLRRELDQLSS